MKKFVAAFVLFLSLSCAQAVVVSFDNLAELIEQNPQLQDLKAQTQQLRERPSRLGTSFIPKVELSAGLESFDKPDVIQDTQPRYSLETSLNLYRGGSDQLQDQKQKLELKTYQAQTMALKKELTMAAYKALAHLLESKEGLAILNGMKSRISEQVMRNKRNVERGQDTGTDLLHFEIKLQEVDLEISELQLENQKYLEELKSYLPKKVHSELTTLKRLEHNHEWDQSYTRENLDQDVFTRGLQLGAREKTLDWKIAQKQGLPEVDLYAAWAQSTQLHEEEFDQAEQRSHKVVGLNFKLPLSRLFTKSDEVATQKAMATQRKVRERLNQKRVENHLNAEFKRLQNIHSKLHQYEQMGKTAQTYAQKVEEEYERGVKSSADVISAYEQMAQMKMKFKRHQAEFMSLLAELFRM